MQYFWETVETIEEGVGFDHFSPLHFTWLAVGAVIVFLNCLWYRKLSAEKRANWRKIIAALLILDELFKMTILFIGGRYEWDYLPLHLCSINIFTITWHAWKPSNFLGNFLYTICIPGALAALLFPSWASLPVTSAMHIHSFTIHILLIMYPIVLVSAGDIKPDWKLIPKCMGLLLVMAALNVAVNLLLDTNFMFLMYAGPGNPLALFEQMWGSHLLGFPVIIAAVLIVMHLPIVLYRKFKK